MTLLKSHFTANCKIQNVAAFSKWQLFYFAWLLCEAETSGSYWGLLASQLCMEIGLAKSQIFM